MNLKRLIVALVALNCLAAITCAGEAQPKPAFLGARLADSDIDGARGALILEVFDDTAAAKAQLEAKDIVTAIGDEVVDSASSLIDEIKKLHAGAKTSLSILRDGEKKAIDVTLGTRPSYSVALRQKKPPRVFGGTVTLSADGTIEGALTGGGNVILPNGVGNVVGNFELDWTGLMDVNLDQHAVLNVTGDVSIAGILNVELSNTKPKPGDKFEIIRDAASLKGEFGKLMLPPIAKDLEWQLIYDNVPKGIDVDADGKHDVTLIVKTKAQE